MGNRSCARVYRTRTTYHMILAHTTGCILSRSCARGDDVRLRPILNAGCAREGIVIGTAIPTVRVRVPTVRVRALLPYGRLGTFSTLFSWGLCYRQHTFVRLAGRIGMKQGGGIAMLHCHHYEGNAKGGVLVKKYRVPRTMWWGG